MFYNAKEFLLRGRDGTVGLLINIGWFEKLKNIVSIQRVADLN
jgi:hypothetical protein